MKNYLRYRDAEGEHWGEVEGSSLYRLSSPPWDPHDRTPRRRRYRKTRTSGPGTPGKIVLVGLNYRAHVAESKSADKVPTSPVIFLKPTTALIGPGESIVKPAGVERVDYEAELAVVIGKTVHRPSLDEAREAIFGLTCLNDVTARPLQRQDVQWTRAKGFDTFCPVGPQIVTGLDWQNLDVESFVNGERKQAGNTRDQIFPVETLLKFIATVMTLHPGDVVSTGTPEGVGPLEAGDSVEIRVEGIGSLINPVANED